MSSNLPKKKKKKKKKTRAMSEGVRETASTTIAR